MSELKAVQLCPLVVWKSTWPMTANAMVYKSAQGTAGHCQERPGSLGIMGPGSEQKRVLYSNLCWLFEVWGCDDFLWDFPCCFRLNHLYLKPPFRGSIQCWSKITRSLFLWQRTPTKIRSAVHDHKVTRSDKILIGVVKLLVLLGYIWLY